MLRKGASETVAFLRENKWSIIAIVGFFAISGFFCFFFLYKNILFVSTLLDCHNFQVRAFGLAKLLQRNVGLIEKTKV